MTQNAITAREPEHRRGPVLEPPETPAAGAAAGNPAGAARRREPDWREEARHPIGAALGALPLALLLAGSGCAALIYQVLWARQLTLIVGIDVYAVTLTVGAFFAGLGLGGWLCGRAVDRMTRPLRFYAVLEIGIGLLGLAATALLARAAPWFAALEEHTGALAWLLPFVLVGAPALLIGGTLPALLRARAPDGARLGGASGALYAFNTGGALAGALLVTFALIPRFGVFGAAAAAALLNLALAALAWARGHDAECAPAADAASSSRPDRAAPTPAARRGALLLYALAGGIALGYEVVWSQALAQFLGTRGFALSVLLATYLGGLVLGSAVYARFADRVRDPWGAFGLLIAGAGLLALLQVAALGAWLPELQSRAADALTELTGSPFAAMGARFAIASCSLVLLPAALLGAAFPAAMRLGARADHIGRDAGAALALNTAGGIAGACLTGFALVPLFGLIRSLGALAAFGALLGVCAARRGDAGRGAHWTILALAAAVALCIALLAPQRLGQLLADARTGELVQYEESAGASVAVLEQRASGGHFRRLYIQGVSNSGDALASLRYMRLQALLPLIIQREEPRSALVIALGTGITAGALTRWPDLERRVCVELLPAVVRAAPKFHGNYHVTVDGRVDIRVRDGRRELLRNPERYDLITLEPPPPTAAGSANLYSRDFYQLARRRLQPGGLFAQWLPLATQNDADTRALVRSFLDAFPHATLWTTELHEMLLIGSDQPITLDAATISARFWQPEVAAALIEVGIGSPAALLATWVTDRGGLEAYAGDADPVTDDRPRIEYADWARRGEIARVLPVLLALATEPPVRGASAQFRAELNAERDRLWGFYAAGLYAYQGRREAWAQTLAALGTAIDRNPYYRWIAGD